MTVPVANTFRLEAVVPSMTVMFTDTACASDGRLGTSTSTAFAGPRRTAATPPAPVRVSNTRTGLAYTCSPSAPEALLPAPTATPPVSSAAVATTAVANHQRRGCVIREPVMASPPPERLLSLSLTVGFTTTRRQGPKALQDRAERPWTTGTYDTEEALRIGAW